jgi:hypothetical protein
MGEGTHPRCRSRRENDVDALAAEDELGSSRSGGQPPGTVRRDVDAERGHVLERLVEPSYIRRVE